MTGPPRSRSHALVSARSLVALDQAARALDIRLNLAEWAPSFDPADSAGNIPLDEQIAYCQALLRDSRESLGLELAMHLPLESTGLWGFLLRSSATFGEMLARARRYQRIVNFYEEFTLEEQGENVAMHCHHPDPSPFGPREHAVALMLCHWLSWGRQLTGHGMPAVSAQFQWRGPRDTSKYESFFGGSVRFGGRHDMMVFPKSYLGLAFRDSAPELGETFEAYAAALVSNLTVADAPLERVKAAIEKGLLSGAGTESEVADTLGITPRTLHRRLSASGTTFRALKHEVVIQRAKDLLRTAKLPLSEVSYLLGFSEPSSFHRAFRRWTGKTPGEWRSAGEGA